ncbi:unnamed protein product [Moneuplotes crassus]|uniref:Uncharacterized protein n=1 Tax=Euplotes crassus TaxID=5936 RepID=A0AAD1U4V7_EUPCR|nr:unnamed protein product [Moneuplotes crassus]
MSSYNCLFVYRPDLVTRSNFSKWIHQYSIFPKPKIAKTTKKKERKEMSHDTYQVSLRKKQKQQRFRSKRFSPIRFLSPIYEKSIKPEKISTYKEIMQDIEKYTQMNFDDVPDEFLASIEHGDYTFEDYEEALNSPKEPIYQYLTLQILKTLSKLTPEPKYPSSATQTFLEACLSSKYEQIMSKTLNLLCHHLSIFSPSQHFYNFLLAISFPTPSSYYPYSLLHYTATLLTSLEDPAPITSLCVAHLVPLTFLKIPDPFTIPSTLTVLAATASSLPDTAIATVAQWLLAVASDQKEYSENAVYVLAGISQKCTEVLLKEEVVKWLVEDEGIWAVKILGELCTEKEGRGVVIEAMEDLEGVLGRLAGGLETGESEGLMGVGTMECLVAGGDERVVERMLKMKLCERLVENAEECWGNEPVIVRAIGRVICCVICYCKSQDLKQLFTPEIMSVIYQCLDYMNGPMVVSKALMAVQRFLENDTRSNDGFMAYFTETGGSDLLEKLQKHPNNCIRTTAVDIIKNFFDYTETDEDFIEQDLEF